MASHMFLVLLAVCYLGVRSAPQTQIDLEQIVKVVIDDSDPECCDTKPCDNNATTGAPSQGDTGSTCNLTNCIYSSNCDGSQCNCTVEGKIFKGEACLKNACETMNSNPCQNNGRCISLPGVEKGYTCFCPPGVRSIVAHCELDERCINNTSCPPDKNCIDGECHDHCITSEDTEEPLSCHEGVCNTTTGRCTCPAGFEGPNCTKKNCHNSPCGSHGTCKHTIGVHNNYACTCETGWTETNCDQAVVSQPDATVDDDEGPIL